MRWLLAVLIGLGGGAAVGQGSQVVISGPVVAVPDGGSVWVYLEDQRACFHFSLTGVTAPLPEESCGPEARAELTAMLQGRTVRLAVERLADDRPTPASVFLDNCLVNAHMAQFLSGEAAVPVHAEAPPRRPVLTLVCLLLRTLLPARN